MVVVPPLAREGPPVEFSSYFRPAQSIVVARSTGEC